MKFLRDLARELLGMFVGDGRLSIGVLAIVAAAALLLRETTLPQFVGGSVLLLGGPILLIENLRRFAGRLRKRTESRPAGEAHPMAGRSLVPILPPH